MINHVPLVASSPSTSIDRAACDSPASIVLTSCRMASTARCQSSPCKSDVLEVGSACWEGSDGDGMIGNWAPALAAENAPVAMRGVGSAEEAGAASTPVDDSDAVQAAERIPAKMTSPKEASERGSMGSETLPGRRPFPAGLGPRPRARHGPRPTPGDVRGGGLQDSTTPDAPRRRPRRAVRLPVRRVPRLPESSGAGPAQGRKKGGRGQGRWRGQAHAGRVGREPARASPRRGAGRADRDRRPVEGADARHITGPCGCERHVRGAVRAAEPRRKAHADRCPAPRSRGGIELLDDAGAGGCDADDDLDDGSLGRLSGGAAHT